MKIKKIRKNDKLFRIKRSKRYSDFVPVITMICLAGIIALPIALLWQKMDTPIEKQTTPQYILEKREQEKASEQAEKSDSEAQDNNSEANTENEGSVPVQSAAVVPKGDWVESSYFDDAVFVGDSLSVGIETYEVMTNAVVLASEGLNPQTILANTAVENKSGQEVKVIDALKEYNPGKIYIMLGSNGFFWLEKGAFINYYTEFVNQVKAQHPDAVIYIQSIMPVTKEKEQSDLRFANSIINEYNAEIIKMCEQLGVNYVNCAEAVAGEDGALPQEASPSDGMHFTATYYRKWMDYLREHTVS